MNGSTDLIRKLISSVEAQSFLQKVLFFPFTSFWGLALYCAIE
jgi:hypothetical protein